MNILIDTNIILEIILQREQCQEAKRLIASLHNGKHHLYVTLGGFYSLLFTVDKYFRKVLSMVDPLRTNSVRAVMTQVLAIVDVAGQDKQSLLAGIHDMNFNDLEDSCQHQAALREHCDYLLTFNIKDFAGAVIPVLTPQQFLTKMQLRP